MNIKNEKGITLIEVLTALGLVALVMGLMAVVQLQIRKDQIRMTKSLESSIDENLAERIIFKDLNGIDPSFNNLTLKDDKGKLFFDYFPGTPSGALTGGIDREVSMNLDGIKEFFFLSQNSAAGSLMFYDPVMAYAVGPTPANFNSAASLEYVSVNKVNWIGIQRPLFWVSGNFLMFDTPAKIHGLTAGGDVNFQSAPRSPIFLGIVYGNDLFPIPTTSSLWPLVINTNPETGATIDSADTFLRNVPSVGGGQTLVRLRSVKVIKYELVADAVVSGYKTKTASLFRSTYVNGAFINRFLLADKVDKFLLRRNSVLNRMVNFKVYKAQSL